MTAGADIDVWGQLAVSLGSVAAELRADRERKRQLAASLWFVSAPAIQFAALPAAPATWGPSTGYAWAVQRVTVAGFGAQSDSVNAYKGLSVLDVQQQNALYTFGGGTAQGAVATWHPGGKGLILMPDQGLVFGGVFTGTLCTVSVDVVQMDIDRLPYYLL